MMKAQWENYILTIFGNVIAKNRTFCNNSIFLQKIFAFIFPPGGGYYRQSFVHSASVHNDGRRSEAPLPFANILNACQTICGRISKRKNLTQ